MNSRHMILIALTLLLALFSLAGLARAYQAAYSLEWWTVDGGGGASSGGSYHLTGTLGQPDAGAVAAGGGYTLAGGFWHGGAAAFSGLKLYLPLLSK